MRIAKNVCIDIGRRQRRHAETKGVVLKVSDGSASRVSESGPDNVLVAEDDPVSRLLLQNWLTRWGYELTIVEDGAAAWRHLQCDLRPRLVLLDWMMPGLDGVEICRRVRALQQEWYSYILMVTARIEQEDVVLALDSGADDFLKKPIQAAELRARMQVGRRILRLQDELARSREQLRLQATHDGLTGLLNRRAIVQMLEDELRRGERAESPVGILMLDLDQFKRINDLHGHLAGDTVLVEVAGRLMSGVRSYDRVGRYGGEEFLIVLPDCSRDLLACFAERIRARVAANSITTSTADINVTVSAGGAVGGGNVRKDPMALIGDADNALYRAKRQGRNCCVFDNGSPVVGDRNQDETALSDG